jgi:hypothetical protein
MIDPKIQQASQYYLRFTQPLDPDQGWQSEDVQLAFMARLPSFSLCQLLRFKDLVRHGELAHVKVGRGTVRSRLLFAPEEIDNFIKRQTTRDFPMREPATFRYGTRKRAKELAIERALSDSEGFLAKYEAAQAAKKAAKKK